MVEKILSEKVDFVPAKFPDSSSLDRPKLYVIISNVNENPKRATTNENMNFASTQKSLKLLKDSQTNGEKQPTQARPKSLQEALNSYSGSKSGKQIGKKTAKKNRQKTDAN